MWPTVAEAAKNAISVRYRLLDYIYTHLYRQSKTGLPMLNPMFFLYPEDENTFDIALQFFYGDSILVSPVTEENGTDVSIYLPNDVFYDFWTHERIQGNGFTQLTNVPFTSIPLHIRGGSIIPMRAESANTTAEVRKQDFVLVIAPDASGQATGSLYLDDGDSIEQKTTSEITFSYESGKFKMTGDFGFHADVAIKNITVLGASPSSNSSSEYDYGSSGGSRTLRGPISLNAEFNYSFS